MSKKVSVRIVPVAQGLRRLAGLVEDLGQQEQWSTELVFQIQLALDEIGDNIVEHGQTADIHTMDVTLISDQEVITVEIADDGRPFDPLTEAPPPDLTSDLENRQPGGLGLHLVRTLMDDMHYRRDQGRNILTLTKRRDT